MERPTSAPSGRHSQTMAGDPARWATAGVRRTDWSAEKAELERLRGADLIDADGLERLGLADYLLGHDEALVEAWDQAHRAYLAGGDVVAAARCVFWIGFALENQARHALATGWFERFGELALERPDDDALAAMSCCAGAVAAFAQDDVATALELFERGEALAGAAHEPDFKILATMGWGRSLVRAGELERGFACMDRVMLAVATGDVTEHVAGVVYCGVIASCLARHDVVRAAEWTGVLGAWCDAQRGLVPFQGECVAHRALLLFLRGEWDDADREARSVAARGQAHVPATARGEAWYVLGELARLRGRPDTARRAYRRATTEGVEAQPGLGRLRLDQGNVEAARAGYDRALEGWASLDTTRPLEILAARIDLELVAPQGDEPEAVSRLSRLLDDLATRIGTPYVHAFADRARGRVALASGGPSDALPRLRRAVARWLELGVPYEAAITRVDVGRACALAGDLDAAEAELGSARSALARLGAKPDVDRVRALAVDLGLRSSPPAEGGRTAAAGPADLSPREVEVLRLVARGMTNRRVAAELGLSERTVARHLSNIFSKLRLANRAAATAYAYETGLVGSGGRS